jgi:Cdc6-like AAA superfamily ATPase
MKIIKNNLSNIPVYKSSVDNTSDLPFIPQKPLPVKSFLLYIVGSPGSGKTSLMMSLLTSHPTKKNKDKNLYYFKFFDNIFIISGSLQTLPRPFLKLLPEEKKLNKYSDDEMIDIIESLQEGDNDNNLIVLDDVIKDLNRSKILSKIFLNRRHITHNSEMEGQGGLAVIVLSQKFTLLNLEYRNAVSHFILFKTSNASELKRIKEEIMYDLNDDEFNELTKLAWKDKFSFIFVDLNKPKNEKYYIKFDKVVFDNDDNIDTIEYESE